MDFRAEDTLLLRLRVEKIQHLCRLLNPESCSAPVYGDLGANEALQLLRVAAGIFCDGSQREQPIAVLVGSVYQCAVAVERHIASKRAAATQ